MTLLHCERCGDCVEFSGYVVSYDYVFCKQCDDEMSSGVMFTNNWSSPLEWLGWLETEASSYALDAECDRVQLARKLAKLFK